MTDITLFDRFWSCYPRKVGKGAAIKAWEKIDPDEELFKQMILAVDAQQRDRRRQEESNKNVRNEKYKKFIPDWPHPSTWLNGQRWLDEIQSVTESLAQEPEEGKIQCPKCSYLEYPHMDNHEHLCSWHFSEKRYAKGPTGLDALRKAYKTRIPQHLDESVTHYLKRALKTGAERMHSTRINKHLNDEEARLEREAIKALQQEGTLETNTKIRTEFGKSFAGLEDKNEWN